MLIDKKDRIFNLVNNALLFLLTLVLIYPLYFIVIASISQPSEVVNGLVYLYPKGFQLEAYKNVFRESQIWVGYRNTIFYTIAGTLYNLALTITAAYVLTKKQLPGRMILTWFFFVTMFFSGGMIPTYLLTKSLGMINSPTVMFINVGVSCWNLIVTRQFFAATIPDSLYEAAEIDGASEFGIFFKIALPLAAPIVAVMALYYGVGHWNDYYTALLYLHRSEYYPLQMVLRNILIQNESFIQQITVDGDKDAIAIAAQKAYMAAAMKYAMIFIASAPMLLAYPFVQKYFIKGVMIGSIKG